MTRQLTSVMLGIIYLDFSILFCVYALSHWRFWWVNSLKLIASMEKS